MSAKREILVNFCDTKYTPLPEGRHVLKLIDIDENEKGVVGQEVFKFIFEVIEGEYEGCEVNCLINKEIKSYGAKNKLGKVVSALRGQDCSVWDSDFDLMSLIGEKCSAFIELCKSKGKKISNRLIEFRSSDYERFN